MERGSSLTGGEFFRNKITSWHWEEVGTEVG